MVASSIFMSQKASKLKRTENSPVSNTCAIRNRNKYIALKQIEKAISEIKNGDFSRI